MLAKLRYTLFVVLAFTNISFFTIGNADFTLFHGLLLVYLFLSLFYLRKIQCKIPPYYFAFVAFIFLSNLWNFATVKFSSLIYTVIVLIELLVLYNLLNKSNLKSLNFVLKSIISMYFVSILISSLFIIKHISTSGALGVIFPIYKDPTGQVRPYGFANEPSYASILLVFVLFVYFKLNNFKLNRKDYVWYLLAIVSVILIRSSYGYLFLAMFLIYMVIKTRILENHLLKIISIVSVFTIVVTYYNFRKISETKTVVRITKLSDRFFNTEGDLIDKVKAMQYIDGSAAMRLFPTVLLIDYYKTCKTTKILLGNGAGQATKFYSRKFEGKKTDLGFFPSFVYNYGIIGTALALLFFYFLFPKRKLLMFFMFFAFCFNADFNTQIFQFILFMAMVAKFIDRLSEEEKIELKIES